LLDFRFPHRGIAYVHQKTEGKRQVETPTEGGERRQGGTRGEIDDRIKDNVGSWDWENRMMRERGWELGGRVNTSRVSTVLLLRYHTRSV